jgi:hypothetical protein
MSVDADLYGADSIANMAESLAGPLRGGAVESILAIPASGIVSIDWQTREPLVLVSPLVPLDRGVSLSISLDGGAEPIFAGAVFERYTEAGACVPIHRPSVDAATRMAQAFSLTIAGTWLDDDGTAGAAISPAALATMFDLRLLEGVLGRLLYALAAEKMRLRRTAIESVAMRTISQARLVALDRIGADLGVLRFSDQLKYDVPSKEILASFDAAGNPIVESDADYRTRLGLYRRFRIPTRSNLISLLNGPGKPSDPNAGPIAELGFGSRFTIDEDDDSFAMTVALVEVGTTGYRANFLNYLRTAFLTWIETSPAADLAHDGRFISNESRATITALRTRLRAAYSFPASAAVAPVLAQSLDQLAAVYAALGGLGTLALLRAQDATAGSRYELGLGVDITPIPAAELDALASAATNVHRAPASDPNVEAAIASMVPVASGSDPDGAWLFSACDFQTIFRVDPATLYLSHLPIDGLVISGPSTVAVGTAATYQTAYQTPGSPNENAALSSALATASTAWTTAGHPAWDQIDSATAVTDWTNAPARATADTGLGVFRAVGLPALETPASVAPQLQALPAAMLATIRLDAPFAKAVATGQTAAITEFSSLLAILTAAGFVSVLPMFDFAGDLLLVVSVIGLPFAGLNLNERRASGFLWYLVPIQGGTAPSLGSIGSSAPFLGTQPGLWAIVVVGFARRGKTGPYEYQIDLPADVLMNVRQYEFVMNLLASVFPIGVTINTYALRSAHIDLDGDGHVDPLPPNLARTYRDFSRSRYRGQPATGLT